MPARNFWYTKTRSLTIGLMTVVAMLSLLSPSAHAGFEWTPPPNQPLQNAAPVMAGPLTPELGSEFGSAPVAPVDGAPIASLPELAPDMSQHQEMGIPSAAPNPDYLPIPGMKSLPTPTNNSVAPMTAEPVPQILSNTAPIQEYVSQQPAAITPAGTNLLSGFGNDIPLALALRDIVPSTYPYAFERTEYAGVHVSWTGGKPWMDVLQAALAPVGLRAAITNNSVKIYAQGKPTPMMAAPETLPLAEPLTPPEIIAPQPSSQNDIIWNDPNQATSILANAPTPKPHTTGDVVTRFNWRARPGSTLRETLESWSKTANVELEWASPYDFPITEAYNFSGTFKEATESLLASYSKEAHQPRGRFFPNAPDGPSVLSIN